MDTGASTGGHFIGSAPDRSGAGFLNEVGAIPDNFNSNNGYAAGSLSDPHIKLNGDDGVVGRSVTVHGDGSSGGVRVAQCVLGVGMAPRTVAKVTKAICQIEPTANGQGTETGNLTFTIATGAPPDDPQTTAEDMALDYNLAGFADGTYGWHIHKWGDILGDDGMSVGGHYIGRTDGRAEVGDFEIDITVSGGAAVGTINQNSMDNAALNGKNSIIGRSIMFHAPGTGARVAQCVIGIASGGQDLAASPTKYAYSDSRAVRRAGCRLTKTVHAGTDDVQGEFFIEQRTSAELYVSYYISGLSDTGTHAFHVHQYGDITSNDATATGGHYIGQACHTDSNCRGAPAGQNEVGFFLRSQFTPRTGGWVTGSFKDTLATLDDGFGSEDYIVGRSIVLHAPGGARIAQCVIGDAFDSEDTLYTNPSAPAAGTDMTDMYTTHAVAYMEPTEGNTAGGVAHFVRQKGAAGNIEIRYHFTGLTASSSNTWHIHIYGDITSTDGADQGGHYVGDCTDCRTGGNPQEAGLIADGATIEADADGNARGVILAEDVLRLHGVNSVVGRGVILHAPGGARIAQGVVGKVAEVELTVADVAPITESICVFRPVGGSSVSGWMAIREGTNSVGIT